MSPFLNLAAALSLAGAPVAVRVILPCSRPIVAKGFDDGSVLIFELFGTGFILVVEATYRAIPVFFVSVLSACLFDGNDM